jgi:hypothetical protein
MTFEPWTWSEQEIDEAISTYEIEPSSFNREALPSYVEKAYLEKFSEGDPWRRGKMYFLDRAIQLMIQEGVAT